MSKKCFEDISGFNDRWVIIVGLPIASLLTSLLLFDDYYEQGKWNFLSICIPMSFMYTGIFWMVLRFVYKNIKCRYPAFTDIWKRLIVLFLTVIVTYLIVNYSLDKFFNWLSPEHVTNSNIIVEFVATLLMSALVITCYEAISFYLQLEAANAKTAQLERQNVESQLEGLRNQVNPHFLFNSLNTLSYLIPEDQDKAVRFVQQLSKVYRYVLESRDSKIIPLAEELEFLKAYIFLQRERFGENLQVNLKDLDLETNAAIVPLTLQMLFENAVKHNIISAEKPLRIEVFVENGHLIVRNNLQRKNQVMDSTGVGLQNIIDRYRMLTDSEVKIIASQQFYTVALPMIHISLLV